MKFQSHVDWAANTVDIGVSLTVGIGKGDAKSLRTKSGYTATPCERLVGMSVDTGFDIKPYVPPRARVKKADPAPLAHGPQRKQHTGFYNFGPVLSRNCLINFIAGARGIGKTYGAKKLGIRRWLKNKQQFIYLRRFEEELKSLDQFFADIQHEFPDWDFKVDGRKFVAAPANTRDEKKREWEVIGFAVALSTAQNRKSISYFMVTLVIFDEFILEKSAQHYLPNEAEVMLNFYNTVDRYQEKTIFLCLANAVAIDNPYFTYLKIIPPTEEQDARKRPNDRGYVKDPEDFWIAHFPSSEEFAASISTTRFGRFIQNTAYYDYAVQNQFSDNHLHLVAKKGEDAAHAFNLELRSGSMSIWEDTLNSKFYALARIVPGQLSITLLPDKMTEDKVLMFPNDEIILRIMAAFRNKRLFFDSPATRNIFLDLYTTRR